MATRVLDGLGIKAKEGDLYNLGLGKLWLGG